MQRVINLTDYPQADPVDLGKYINIGYGAVDKVPAHCIVSGAASRLIANITDVSTLFEVTDATAYPSPPFIVQLDSELILIGASSGNVFTDLTRPYGGTATASHRKGRLAYEIKSEYVYLISEDPVDSIRDVYIDKVRQPDSAYIAYTGKTGDSHADYAGKAVVAFSANTYAGPQYNLDFETAYARDSGETITAAVTYAGCNWQSYGHNVGAILYQDYNAVVTNPVDSGTQIRVVVKNTSADTAVYNRIFTLPGSQSVDISFRVRGGEWATTFSVLPYVLNNSLAYYGTSLTPWYFNVIVNSMGKDVTRTPIGTDSADNSILYTVPTSVYYDSIGVDYIDDNGLLIGGAVGRASVWAVYDSTSLGEITRQTHTAIVTAITSATVRMIAVTSDSVHANEITNIDSGDNVTITLVHSQGAFHTKTAILGVGGQVRVHEISKAVNYTTDDIKDSDNSGNASTARIVIGAEVVVDADWQVDSSGAYGGSGTLITRPDNVIKHLLIEKLNFSATEIDSDSFIAAGSDYVAFTAAGYQFGFVINQRAVPSELMQRLAYESRSNLNYSFGTWYLDTIPGSGPAPIRTIRKEELAGAGAQFRFDKTPISEVGNNITTKYDPSYSYGFRESEWGGVITVADSASQVKYGRFDREVQLQYVRDTAMATSVSSIVLIQRSVPLLRATFPVFWTHFDLRPGQTITISNDIYSGKKYFVEKSGRNNKGVATVEVIEWFA